MLSPLILAVTFTASNAEIVIPKDAVPVVRFAAAEAKTFLSQSLGAEVPVVNAPTAGKSSLILGMNEWAAAAGLSTNGLPRDAFVSAAKGSAVYLLGYDHPTVDPEKVLAYGDWGPIEFARATTFALYHFLAREAGVRMYFPGELGTVVPRRGSIEVAEGVRTVKPAFTSRLVQMWHGEWFEPKTKREVHILKTLDFFRLRLETWRRPCCHGSLGFSLRERFGKDHPEYFALLQNGTRANVPGPRAAGRLCWTSKVVDEMYADAASYLRGEGPEVRGLLSRDLKKFAWRGNFSERKYVDVMPDDCFDEGCLCPNCRAREVPGSSQASDIIWGAVSNMAARLTADGIDGRIDCMAYTTYRQPPSFDLPDNVEVMVAMIGPWGVRKAAQNDADNAVIRAWAKKLGRNVWLWNYANKCGIFATKAKNIVTLAPRAWAEYYKSLADVIDGAFCESETERLFFNYLNYYVYSRVCWDVGTDVEAVLDEHHRLMFGAASAEMKAVYDELEEMWMGGMMSLGVVLDTPMGPTVQPPSNDVLWNRVFSPERRAALRGLVAAARAKVAPGSLEARRIDLVEREYLDTLDARAAEVARQTAVTAQLKLALGAGETRKFPLVPFRHRPMTVEDPVRTDVTLSRTADKLTIRFDCEEPHMDSLQEGDIPRDDPNLWKDNCVEVVLAPQDDGRFYHIFLTSRNCVADSQESHLGVPCDGRAWNLKGLVTRVERRADGWSGILEIPLSSLPGLGKEMKANFARERNLMVGKEYHRLYHWAPYAIGFGDLENIGTLELEKSGPDYTMSPVDGGGASFDFEKLSAGIFKDDPSQPNLAAGLKWTHSGRREVAFKGADGEFSIVAPAAVKDSDIASWDATVDVGPNPDGRVIRISFLYRSHGMDGRVCRTYCIPYDLKKPGSYDTAVVSHSDGFNWFQFSREFKVAPGVTRFRLCQRHDGPGDFSFRDLAIRVVRHDPSKPPVELLCSPHGYLGRTFAVSSNQCGIIHYLWRRPEPLKGDSAKDYSYVFELDPGFELVEPMFGDEKSVKTVRRPDGGTTTTFAANMVPGKDYNSWFRFGMLVATKSPVGTRGQARLTCLYRGKPCSNVETLDLFVIPEILARRPKRYMTGFQQASASGFLARSDRGRKAIAELSAASGIGLFYGSRDMIAPMRAAGVKWVLGSFSASNGFQIGDGSKTPPDEKYVPLTTWHWGMDSATCPVSVYQEKPFFMTNTVPMFRRQLEGFDGAMSNWEPYYYTEQGCMCDSCCREFAKWSGLDYDDVRKDWPKCIDRRKGRYGKNAREFRSWQHGQMMKTLNKYVTQFTGGEKSMGFIPEIEFGMMTTNWRETHHFGEFEVKDFGDDFKWMNPWGPYGGVWFTSAPYVHNPASWVVEFYSARNVRKASSSDWPKMKIMSFPNGYQCGGMVVEPEYMELAMDSYFFNRWDASCLYFFPVGYDNRYWAALARATTTAADYEEFVWDGVRIDEKASLEVSGDYPPPVVASSSHVPEFRNASLLQHVAYELGGRRLVAVFNFSRDRRADFTLRFADRKGEWRLSAPALRCVVFVFR